MKFLAIVDYLKAKFGVFSQKDFGFNACAVILYLVASGVEIWYASGIWQPDCNAELVNVQKKPCLIIVGWIVAAVLCVINTILYIISAWMANNAKFYL